MISLDHGAHPFSDSMLIRGVQFWGLNGSEKVSTLRKEYRQLREQLSDLVRDQDRFLHKVFAQFLFR